MPSPTGAPSAAGPGTPSPEGDPAADAWRLISGLFLEGEGRSCLFDACRRVGLPVNLVKAMLMVDRSPLLSMRELAERFDVDASYCTALVDGLESHGVARRVAHPTDRRVKTVALTDHGTDVVAEVRRALEVPPPALRALSHAEQVRLRGLLRKVAEADPNLV